MAARYWPIPSVEVTTAAAHIDAPNNAVRRRTEAREPAASADRSEGSVALRRLPRVAAASKDRGRNRPPLHPRYTQLDNTSDYRRTLDGQCTAPELPKRHRTTPYGRTL